MEQEQYKKLIRAAFAAKERAYAPYSHFRVGAALLCSDGTIYGGCNIENAAYTPSNCAERTAVFQAVADGRRSFLALAVVGDRGQYVAPCGVCRQVLTEFCDADTFEVVLAKNPDEYKVWKLGKLFPCAFSPDSLTV